MPAGSYFVTVDASIFTSFKTQQFAATAGQAYSVPQIPLAIAGLNMNVIVRPTEEVEAEQIKAEEKQRALGVSPHFYVSYVLDAAPFTSKQKTFDGCSRHIRLDQLCWRKHRGRTWHRRSSRARRIQEFIGKRLTKHSSDSTAP